MLENIFGSRNKERILIFLLARKEGYAREIAKFYESSLSPIQNLLDKLEAGSVLSSRTVGKTRVYSFNPRYPFLKELNDLLEKAFQFIPKDEKEKLIVVRKRPRRKGKPI